jgi:hypothetical protein
MAEGSVAARWRPSLSCYHGSDMVALVGWRSYRALIHTANRLVASQCFGMGSRNYHHGCGGDLFLDHFHYDA